MSFLRLSRYVHLAAAGWGVLITASVVWGYYSLQQNNYEIALQTARAFFQQILISRAWNAGHGGVYVPITESTQPNPHLKIANRDIVTTEGIRLTRINPSFMTRQIAELASHTTGVKFHITSLKPIRPQNKAVPWEETWLREFEQGLPETGAFFRQGETLLFRYMAPLHADASCLACHGEHGYKVGDIRGGISVTLPFFRKTGFAPLFIVHIITGLAGLVIIYGSGVVITRKRRELEALNESLKIEVKSRINATETKDKLIEELAQTLEQVKTLEDFLPLCSSCRKIRIEGGDPQRQEDWLELEAYLKVHTGTQVSHSICPSCMRILLDKNH